jgi:hypothetical protein
MKSFVIHFKWFKFEFFLEKIKKQDYNMIEKLDKHIN